MISKLDSLIFRTKYLNPTECSNPIVKKNLIGLITLFKQKIQSPQRGNHYVCIITLFLFIDNTIQLQQLDQTYVLQHLNGIKSFLTLRYQDLEISLRLYVVVLNFQSVVS